MVAAMISKHVVFSIMRDTPYEYKSSNVAHERPSKQAKPACEGPPRWAG